MLWLTVACRAGARGLISFVLLALAGISAALADDLYHSGDIDVRWDNTLRYTAGFRVEPRDYALLYVNGDDGDRNFDPGLITNRLDALSQFELTDGDFGLRISVAGWYDSVYRQRNDNDSPATFNPFSVPHDRFTRAVRVLHGADVELDDAFVHGSFDVAGTPLTFRIGRYVQVWGESVFFGETSIAGGQAPTDVIEELTQPASYAKALFMPVWQTSATAQLSDNVSVSADYQFQWRKDRQPGAGSYFSWLDFMDEGGERIILAPGHYLYRGHDQRPPDGGQFGVALNVSGSDVSYGFYALRFDAKEPQLYLFPGRGAHGDGKYQLVYPTGIELYGASLSSYIGDDDVAGELSLRTNQPLVSTPAIVSPGEAADNEANARYAIGNALHGQASEHHVFAANALWDRAELNVELAADDRLSVARNAAALDRSRDRFSTALEATFEPQYFEVLPALDLSVPITFGHGLIGRSSIDDSEDTYGSGTFSVGVSATYRSVWQGSVNFTHFLGSPADQFLADRDFVLFTVQRTF
jgi:hypothetical protein